jgi:hypothetical protein
MILSVKASSNEEMNKPQNVKGVHEKSALASCVHRIFHWKFKDRGIFHFLSFYSSLGIIIQCYYLRKGSIRVKVGEG